MQSFKFNPIYVKFTRIYNFIFALGLVLLCSPLMYVIYMLILFLDGRPIFYYGARLGKNRKTFEMYKFRTLRIGSEKAIGGRLMLDDDGYITPLGHFLRRLKLDELPQLFNILRGDMNFVGPRPVRPSMAAEYSKIIGNYEKRFFVKPGLTGLAQLRGGYYCAPEKKTRYDLFYIRKRGILLDLKLLFLTAYRAVMCPNCLKSGDRPVGAIKVVGKQQVNMTPRLVPEKITITECCRK